MSLLLLTVVLQLNHVRSDGEAFESLLYAHGDPIIYPQCINKTHDNMYTEHDSANESWHETIDTIYNMGACGVWRASASVLTTNLMLTGSGFGSGGITSGSIAAVIQSYLGNVASGSIFSSLQSLGAVGGISVFGSMGLSVFIAWSVICGDFIDIDINFMDQDATQCFMNEKLLYLSIEQSEEIITWFLENEHIQSMAQKMKETDDKYDFSEGIMKMQEKANNMFSWMTEKGGDIIRAAEQMDEEYKIKKTIQQKMDTLAEKVTNFFL